MEHLEGENPTVLPVKEMSQSENAPVSYYGDNGMGSGASAALLAGLATRDNYNPVDMVTSGGVCDLRAEVSNNRWFVKDAEANIRRDIAKEGADGRTETLREGQENMAAIKDAECNLSKEILETRHTLAKDILRAEYESKLAIQAAIKEINEKVDRESERTNDKVDKGFDRNRDVLAALKDFNAEKFCDVQKQLAKCCCEIEGLVGPISASTSQQGLVNAIVSALNVSSK